MYVKIVICSNYKLQQSLQWSSNCNRRQSGLWACKQDTLLRNVHTSVTCIRTRNIFQDLVSRLTRSGLQQWVAGDFVRAWESREVEAWTGHDKGKYSVKSIIADKTEFQSTQRPCTTPGSSWAMLTIVIDVKMMTRSVPISSLNILNGTSAGQGTWQCDLPAKFSDRE